MIGKIVTLYLDNSQIKLLVTSGKRIKKMAELPVDFGATKVKSATRETEIASKITQLLKAKNVNAHKIILGISGMHCLTRPFTLPALPKAMQEEAVMREAKRVLPIPPDQLYISWQIFPGLEQEQLKGFLVAIPRRIADLYLKALQQVGLKPYLIDLKPLALARLIDEPTAIMIDIQASEFDIVVIVNGLPQPVRTMPFASESLSGEEKLAAVREELAKTIEFYNSNNLESPLSPQIPLYVSGELDDLPELSSALADTFNYPLKQLTSPLKCPKEMDPFHYLVNIGLATKELNLGKRAGSYTVNVNALPIPYRPKPLPLMKLLTVPVALMIIGSMFMMAMFIQNAAASITDTRTQLDTTEQIIKTRQTQKSALQADITSMEKKISQAKSSYGAFTTVKETIDRQGEIINNDLTAITGRLVTGITLAGVSHSSGKVNLRGSSLSEEEVLSYARNLEDSKRFSQITISNIVRTGSGEDERWDFTLVLTTGTGGEP